MHPMNPISQVFQNFVHAEQILNNDFHCFMLLSYVVLTAFESVRREKHPNGSGM